MIVVDASALVAFFLREEGWRELANYMARTISVDHVVKEFYNAVWKAYKLRRRITLSQAQQIIKLFKQYIEYNMELRSELEYVDEALSLAASLGVTVYDALYIALARSEQKPLLTLDEHQRKAAARIGVRVLP